MHGFNGDILVWNHVTRRRHELSSMGIRVNAETLRQQLGFSGLLDFLEVPLSPSYHQQPGPAEHWRGYRPVAHIDAFAAQGAPGRSQRHRVAEDPERDVREEEHPRPRMSGPGNTTLGGLPAGQGAPDASVTFEVEGEYELPK